MASNQQQYLNTLENVSRSGNSTPNDATELEPDSIQTGTAMSAHELHELNRTDDILVQQQIDMNDPFCEVCSKYEIKPKMAKYLHKLRDFEIVIVCDDSGSMMTPVDGTQRTRWDELCSIVKIIVEIGVIFDSNGVDIYFLNRKHCLQVKDPINVDQAFAIPASGYTPLVPVLNRIFNSQLARRGRDKKLLVFVATDGVPTDNNGNPNISELEHLMRQTRQVVTTYVSFLLCTDEPECVNYLDEWDRTMTNVDVTDDFHTEREKIRRCLQQNNYPFSHGDYIVKALVGAIVPEIDRLNELN